MYRIFISHTSGGREYARGIKKSLQDFGDDTFLDETDLALGGSFAETIRTTLRSVDYLVALLTERAADSPRMMLEIGAAWALGKRVVPILLADLDPDRLDYLGFDQEIWDARKLKPEETAQRIRALPRVDE